MTKCNRAARSAAWFRSRHRRQTQLGAVGGSGRLDGELIEEAKIATRPEALEKYCRSWPRLRVVLETGTHSNWMRRLIAGLRHEVLVANARQLRLISQSDAKNGCNDAYWLAELGRTNPALLAPVKGRDLQIEQHRSWLRGRETLVESRTKLINSLRGIAKSHGIRLGRCGMSKWETAVREQCPAVLATVLEPMARVIVALTREINALDPADRKAGRAVAGHVIVAHRRRGGSSDEPGLCVGVE